MKKTKKIIIFSVIIALIIAFCTLSAILLTNKKSSVFCDYWQQKVDSFAVQNANLSKGQIVFVGDSITDLYHLDDHYTDLTLATYNRGIGGDTTSGVLNRMNQSIFDLSPSKIVLMIGINDINGGESIDKIEKNYKEILKQIKEKLPETKVYCMSVLPIGTKILDYIEIDLAERNALIKQFDIKVQNLATIFEYTYLDLFSLVCDENDNMKDEYTIDWGHLSEAGFCVWTNLIKPYLI